MDMNALTISPTVWQRSTTLRFLRWLGTWRGLGTVAVVAASAVTLLTLLYAFENWRGYHAWNRVRQQLLARGEAVDVQAFIPAPVPDEENFAAAPLFQHTFHRPPRDTEVRPSAHDRDERLKRVGVALGIAPDRTAPELGTLETGEPIDLAAWQRFYAGNTNYPQPAAAQSAARDVLLALSRFDPELDELRQAATHPRSRFAVDYATPQPWSILLPHLPRLRGLGNVLLLRATARLDAGQAAEALADLQLLLRLGDSIRDEPLLLSFVVRQSLIADVITGTREGLARRAWTNDQLVALDRLFAATDLLAELPRALQAERAWNLTQIEYYDQHRDFVREQYDSQVGLALVLQHMPRGWYYANMQALTQLYESDAFPMLDPRARRIHPHPLVKPYDDSLAARAWNDWLPPRAIEAFLDQFAVFRDRPRGRWSLFKYLFAVGSYRHPPKLIFRTAQRQTQLELARVACALERYRLADGGVPEALDALTPTYLASVPPDLITGGPLQYRRDADDRYLLYAVGWDGQDHGGRGGRTAKSGPTSPESQRDWVWPVPRTH